MTKISVENIERFIHKLSYQLKKHFFGFLLFKQVIFEKITFYDLTKINFETNNVMTKEVSIKFCPALFVCCVPTCSFLLKKIPYSKTYWRVCTLQIWFSDSPLFMRKFVCTCSLVYGTSTEFMYVYYHHKYCVYSSSIGIKSASQIYQNAPFFRIEYYYQV